VASKRVISTTTRASLLAVAYLFATAPVVLGQSSQSEFRLAPTWLYDLYDYLPPGSDRFGISGINNNYDIIGTGQIDGITGSFLVSGGVATVLAYPHQFASSTVVRDINDNKEVAGTVQINGADYPFRYSGGTFHDIPPFGYPQGSGTASGINSSQLVVGWKFGVDILSGFVAGPTTGAELPSLDPTLRSYADINDANHIVGVDVTGPVNGACRGFLAFGDTVIPIAHPGADQTEPDALNNRDAVVGSWIDPVGTQHGFVWTNGKSVAVDYPGAAGTWVRGINDDGVIAGHYQFNLAGPAGSFIGVPRSPVNVLVNGQEQVTLDSTEPLRIDLGFHAPPSGRLSTAELYIGVATSTGTWWLNSNGGLGLLPTRFFAGSLGGFGPSPLIDVSHASVLPPGIYTFFMIVDDETNAAPNAVFWDSAQVTIR
jgi:hypothetical protein